MSVEAVTSSQTLKELRTQLRSISKSTVHSILQEFHYGPEMMMVDTVWINEENPYVVGVLDINNIRTAGHFDLFPGIKHAEAVGQTFLVANRALGKLSPNMMPILTTYSFQLEHMATINGTVNILVKEDPSENENITIYGALFSGERLLSFGTVTGQIKPKEKVLQGIRINSRLQQRDVPIFPLDNSKLSFVDKA